MVDQFASWNPKKVKKSQSYKKVMMLQQASKQQTQQLTKRSTNNKMNRTSSRSRSIPMINQTKVMRTTSLLASSCLVLFGLIVLVTLKPISGSQLTNSGSSSSNTAIQSVLLDTTEQSALGWTKYPDGGPQTRTPGWVEESFTNFERGINWRSFVVCDVAFNSVNNWLWTPFIERGDANRLYIEIKFTMRDCNLFPQMVLSCKETFALLYKELDTPIGLVGGGSGGGQQFGSAANASFAQSDSFTLIDAIAADEGRFTSNTDVVINTEIRSIPVSKRGVYFAFRDQGACLSLISIKVYHTYCPQLSTNFALFNATPTGRDLTSLVAVEGNCVPNSLQIEQPKMFCAADGNWNIMSAGQCKCLQGFEPAANQTKCQACPPGKFKASLGELACQTCPEHSSAPYAGASECKCREGYHRAPKDSRSSPCTQAPSGPTNLTATYVDSSSVILQWQAPKFTGHRDDITYKLLCDQCDQTMVSSPQFYSNFSETKCVISGLSPSTSYRFVLYAMNGVSQLTQQAAQYSEISLQTQRPTAPTSANTLSSQGGFQLSPIYNFRALPGARGSDMLLAWDAQPLQADGSSGASLINPLDSIMPASLMQSALVTGQSGPVQDGGSSAGAQQLLPSLYEIRFQPRSHSTAAADRRSPYSASLIGQQQQLEQASGQQQSVTTTNRAVAISTLQPRTEYAFQIRAKWAHTNQWTDFTEPIFMATTNQLTPVGSGGNNNYAFEAPSQQQQIPFLQQQQQAPASNQQQQQPQPQSAGSWLSTFAMGLLCALISLALLSVGLVHYRKSTLAQLGHRGGGFGTFGFGGAGGSSGSTYGAVYGSGAGSDLMGAAGVPPLGFGSPLGAGHAHLAHHQATLSAGSAGGLITGSNAMGRSSSGAGNVVQNFIAATLNSISGHHQHSKGNGPANHTMGGDGKLFASINQSHQQRNHYHQTLSNLSNSMLLGAQNQQHQQLQQQQLFAPNHQQQRPIGNQCSNPQSGGDLFKYRTLGQPGAAHFLNQQDPHIYDDLDTNTITTATTATPTANTRQLGNSSISNGNYEIEPQRVSIESVIGRGEFGDVCLGLLKSLPTALLNGPNVCESRRVAVKTLKAQANDKAKLDFLVEASIMSQFNHPNVIHLEGVVTKSEPPMIITEFMENGALDSYLRDNKNRFTCLQLISMLRGIANGMQYLAKLNYVHKDLAARNILVNGQNVCKIADFGLSAHQSTGGDGLPLMFGQMGSQQADYSNDSTSTNSSNTMSSQTTGSTPTTASTMAGSSNLNQLQSVAEQMAQQRFAPLQQPLPQQQQPLSSSCLPQSIQNPKIPVRWTALEAIAFRRFTSASDVWSFGVVCWEVMTQGERPYWNWSNQDVIKAVEQGYRLPQPEGCPEQLYKMMLDCWLKDRAARPSFGQLLIGLDRLLSPYDDPFCQPQLVAGIQVPQQQQQPQLVATHPRISSQEPAYYDTYNPISQLLNNKSTSPSQNQTVNGEQQSVDEWLNSIKMSRYRDNFQRHQINSLQYVARLSQADLSLIGIQNGQHLKKILNAIMGLRSASSIGASGEGYLV